MIDMEVLEVRHDDSIVINRVEVEVVKAHVHRIEREVQATRWAMWHVIDALWSGNPIDGQWNSAHETDVGIALVEEGRRREQEREAKGLNNLPTCAIRILEECLKV